MVPSIPVMMNLEAQRLKQHGNNAYKKKDFATALEKWKSYVFYFPGFNSIVFVETSQLFLSSH